MTFISYSQNLEDVILERIFKDIEKGFYIDVGANDPVAESVTKAFYDRGWRGINIEPVHRFYQRLCKERAEDINLPVAAGAEDGFFLYYEIPGTGLSTLDRGVAEQHEKNGWTVVKRNVSVIPLSTICRQFAKESIHFLKVDVEGAEQQVLQGMDFRQYRPWVVIVEATLPLSQEQNYEHWEDILLSSGYQYVYFDGLNRFYIADEKVAELKTYFSAPPNCFDEYQRYTEYLLQVEKNTLMQQNKELALEIHNLQEELRKTYSSRPWRIKAQRFPVNTGQGEQVAVLSEQLRQEVSRRRLNAKC